MKKLIIILIVVGMVGYAVYDFAFTSDKQVSEEQNSQEHSVSDNAITSPPKEDEEVKESDEVGLDKGQLAPNFELTTLDGEKVKLSDFKGEKVFLNFWATWCPPCRAEMPDLQKLHENKDVKILAVNLTQTESDPDKIQAFMDKLDLTFTVPLDKQSTVGNQYQIQPIPTTFMIDSNGRIQNKAFGALNYEMMVQEVEKLK
ncbi:TlpA family protein disulfide reductase [Virgibacillus alimentarius]|uniref:Peroxiredoxin n=1 Tax=Virgibacillus alimentarius TaxID=698769 RepID=A0ABS4S6M7_9BACI|nr:MULTISPECIES: redoxin domain-containing protein [Virgibacillus]MBP2257160.1 peroxiredoxin [Virgibacillus alimentarius]HLR69389.1 redoxin domain-containing protein [Virgibacillus sp.]